MTTTLELLAWIIGFGNPIAATLHGPALARWLGTHGRRHLIEPAQGTAWAVLFLTQCTFLAFGVISALGGFRWAQGLMIPVAAINFWVWWKYRPGRSTPLERFTAAMNEAKRAGTITVQRVPQGAAEVYADGKFMGYSTNIRITPLDADGKPVGDHWMVMGRTTVQGAEHVEHRVYGNSGARTALARAQGMAVHDAFTVRREQAEENPVGAADKLTAISMEHAHENYRADLRRWQTDPERDREQCDQPVHDASGSAPERCANDLHHEGECSP